MGISEATFYVWKNKVRLEQRAGRAFTSRRLICQARAVGGRFGLTIRPVTRIDSTRTGGLKSLSAPPLLTSVTSIIYYLAVAVAAVNSF